MTTKHNQELRIVMPSNETKNKKDNEEVSVFTPLLAQPISLATPENDDLDNEDNSSNNIRPDDINGSFLSNRSGGPDEVDTKTKPQPSDGDVIKAMLPGIPEDEDEDEDDDDMDFALDYDDTGIDRDSRNLDDELDGVELKARRGIGEIDLESPDLNVYQHKKTLAQGMMDLALLSANANQLRYVVESHGRHPYYYPSLVMISFSLFLQVAVGVGLIWNAKYDIKKDEEIHMANKVNNFTISGIFLVTVVNVFISAFGVASGEYEPIRSGNTTTN